MLFASDFSEANFYRYESKYGPDEAMTPHQVSVAAESFAAGLFAQSGYDVLVQYGANLPNYDLVVVGVEKMEAVSVKGSKDGGWALAISKKKKGMGITYHAAIDEWLRCQRPGVIFCFVQFLNVGVGEIPRSYLASAPEVAAHLKTQCFVRGHLALMEDFRVVRPKGRYTDRIPSEWKFTHQRFATLTGA